MAISGSGPLTVLKSILFFVVAAPLIPLTAHATYSIIACDKQTRACGVAVQTNNLAVGASVPYAVAGVGALVSQFETNPNYGPLGLALLSQGKTPAKALAQILSEDNSFDGGTTADRQVAIVGIDGRTAVHTGENAQNSTWAGSRTGDGYSIQGNGLVGARVIDAMEHAYVENNGTLAAKLMAALIAGDAAGGQTTGRESAALLLKTTAGWPMDIDLRVDDSADPVAELNRLFRMYTARQQIVASRRAATNGQPEVARSLFVDAVAQSSNWPRVLLPAAHIALDIGQPNLALEYLTTIFSKHPSWIAAEVGDGTYAALGHDATFHKWITADMKRAVEADAETFAKISSPSQEQRLQLVQKLLEMDRPEQAIAILKKETADSHNAPETDYLLALAYTAQSNPAEAHKYCRSALETTPADNKLHLQLINLERRIASIEHSPSMAAGRSTDPAPSLAPSSHPQKPHP